MNLFKFWACVLLLFSLFIGGEVYAQAGKVKITGKVTDALGPLSGVTILEKGKHGNGVASDKEGNYSISVSPNATLEFHFIGYETREVKPTSTETNIDVQLKESASMLEGATVSTGYNVVDRRLFTGSTVKLSSEDVRIEGMADLSRMLEGRAAGLSVQNVSGTFGAAPKIRVRGVTSINGNNKPLWVLDGVVLEDVVDISMDQLASGDAVTLLGSAVSGINPDDIESFQVLKDASATALYGARAMNGVIVINTKKGRAGTVKVSYTGNFMMNLKPRYEDYDLMNSAEQMSVYKEMERKGWFSSVQTWDGKDGGIYTKFNELFNMFDENGKFLYSKADDKLRKSFFDRYALTNTDWFDVLFRNSISQDHSLSFTSGTDKAQHYGSVSFFHDNGWTVADKVSRYTANMRSNYKLSENITLGVLTSGSIRNQKAPGSMNRDNDAVTGQVIRNFDINPFSYALNTSRTLTAFDDKGNKEYFRRNYAPFNILSELENNYMDINVLDLKIQAELGWKITKNLKFDALGAIRYVKSTREHNVTEYSNQAQAYRAAGNSTIRKNNPYLYSNPDDPSAEKLIVLPEGGLYYRYENDMQSYYMRNNLSWNKTFNDVHIASFFAGYELNYASRKAFSFTGYGYQFDKGGVPFTDYNAIKQLLENNNDYYSNNKNEDRGVAFFMMPTYSYKGKYTLSFSGRYDGSNKMGKATSARWLPTWTASGLWNVHEESWMKDIAIISALTLRASHGLVASMGNASNSLALLLNKVTLRPYVDEKESAIIIEALENSDLTWEKQYETNFGVDLSMLDNRINISTDVYQRRGFDLIGLLDVSGIGGELKKVANYGKMKSSGIEFTLGSDLIRRRNFSYNTNFTFSYTRNEITNYENRPMIYDLVSADGGARLGGPQRGLYSIPFAGLDPKTGVPTFYDQKGNIVKDIYLQSRDTEFLIYEGRIDPSIVGGWANTFSYKNFTLNVFFSYQLGNKLRLNPYYKDSYSDLSVMPKEFNDRWLFPGDEKITNIPTIADKLTSDELKKNDEYAYNVYNYSNVRVAKGDFLRLKNISLNYQLPKTVTKFFRINSGSLQIMAVNPWLIYSDKRLNGQDPEFFSSGGVAMPIAKQYTFTLKLGF